MELQVRFNDPNAHRIQCFAFQNHRQPEINNNCRETPTVETSRKENLPDRRMEQAKVSGAVYSESAVNGRTALEGSSGVFKGRRRRRR